MNIQHNLHSVYTWIVDESCKIMMFGDLLTSDITQSIDIHGRVEQNRRPEHLFALPGSSHAVYLGIISHIDMPLILFDMLGSFYFLYLTSVVSHD